MFYVNKFFTGKDNPNRQLKYLYRNQTSKSLLCPCPKEIKLAVPAHLQSPWAISAVASPWAISAAAEPACLRNVTITTTAMTNTKSDLELTKNPKLLLVMSWMKIQLVKTLFPWLKKMLHFPHQKIDAYLWHLLKKYVRPRENKKILKKYMKKNSHSIIYL